MRGPPEQTYSTLTMTSRNTGYLHFSHSRKPTAVTEQWSQVIGLGFLHEHASPHSPTVSPTPPGQELVEGRTTFPPQKSTGGIRAYTGRESQAHASHKCQQMITQTILQAKLPVQENDPTINLLMTRIDPTVLECSQEALSLKDIRGDSAVSTSLHQDHLGASPLSLDRCLGY